MTKTSDDVEISMRHFFGTAPCKRFYSDAAPELIRAAIDLKIMHDTSTPNLPDTNGVAERVIRRIVEGTKCLLEQAGSPSKW